MRYVPASLQAHLQGDATTTCRLLRIEQFDGTVLGMTTLDRDVAYEGVVYRTRSGIDTSVISTDVGLSVDNAEAFTLASEQGLEPEEVNAGSLDDARWTLMLVNYRDLNAGHIILDAGDVGRVTTENADAVTVELISFAMRLRQKIGTLDSRTCRAEFGAPAEGQRGCGVDAESLWVAGTVTGVSVDEPRRLFSASALPTLPDITPGRVQWLTGRNAARVRMYQVEDYLSDSDTIALMEQTPYPIAVGDTFKVRQDCDKLWTTCKNRYGNLLNFKGEPYIPSGDGIE